MKATNNESLTYYFVNPEPVFDVGLILYSHKKDAMLKCDRMNKLHSDNEFSKKFCWNVYQIIFTDYHIEKI